MKSLKKVTLLLPLIMIATIFLYGRKQDISKLLQKEQKVSYVAQADSVPSTCDEYCTEDEKNVTYDQGYAICENEFPKAYSAPGRIDVCEGFDAFVTGSFIYWNVSSDQLDLGVSKIDSTYPNQFDSAIFKFDYVPGFKVGLGVSFNHDNWDLFSQYTRIHENKTTSYTPPTRDNNDLFLTQWFFLVSDTHPLNEIEGDITAKWKADFDKVDLELARSYYLGTNLIARPFIGGSIHFLNQRYKLTINVIESGAILLQEVSIKNDSWAIGPRFGLGSNYLIYKGFRIFGYGAISLLYADNEIKGNGNEIPDGQTILFPFTFNKMDKKILRDVEEFQLGLGWGSYFTKNQWHMDLSVAYEAQRYAKTNFMGYLGALTAIATEVKPGDFYLHGLTVSARFDF
ncbi:MAG: hypothetical protein K1060chlam3_00618 [Candidatus Anoxychlamydiales bacterium]|nr:hypothetical protein [Candidatus Anoxychlamydiales bacterium]